MIFEIMQTDWYKRREPTVEKDKIKNVEVIGFQKIDNSICVMKVEYESGEILELSGYTNVNEGNNRWTVNGLNPHGVSVLVRLVE